MKNKNLFIASVILLAVSLAGCGAVSSADETQNNSTVEPTSVTIPTEAANSVNSEPTPSTLPAVAPLEIPLAENELAQGEYSWSQLLSRDAIFPVYNPEFAPVETAPYNDTELVIGVEMNGEAKAYAIGPLNGREMVNDTVGGVPILVTW